LTLRIIRGFRLLEAKLETKTVLYVFIYNSLKALYRISIVRRAKLVEYLAQERIEGKKEEKDVLRKKHYITDILETILRTKNKS